MRNFSCINATTFATYSINHEYGGSNLKWSDDSISDCFDKVLQAVADAMESTYEQLHPVMQYIAHQGTSADVDNYEFDFVGASPSEFSALVHLWIFFNRVRRSDNAYWLEKPTMNRSCISYVYCNLNDGYNVVWTHLET